MTNASKIWFITGVSRGLGRTLAEAALARGDTVIGTTRSGSADLVRGKGRFDLLALEMTDPVAVKRTVAAAFELHGRIDVIVNNAGSGLLSSIEGVTDEEVDEVFAVNFHGPRRLIQAALERMRKQRSGHIVNVSSMASVAPNPGVGYYAAAKAAIGALSQCLAKEVGPLGIRVTIVEPSAFRTEFLSDRSLHRSAVNVQEDYAETVGASFQRLSAMTGKEPGDPARAAAAILQVVDSPSPPLHLVLGSNAYARARQVLDAFSAELEVWKPVTVGADFDATRPTEPTGGT